MTFPVPRWLLAFASFLLITGAVVHAAAFNRAGEVIGRSDLPRFYSNTFKAFWLADSTTMILGALVFGVVAANPLAATRLVVALVALVYAAIAVLLYIFLGSFFAAHILLLASAAALCAGLQLH